MSKEDKKEKPPAEESRKSTIEIDVHDESEQVLKERPANQSADKTK